MVLKNYLLFAGLALMLQNCQNTAKSVDDAKNKLSRVEWSTYGGERGYVEKLVITRDSISHSTYTTMNNDETVNNNYKNSPEKWQKLLDAFNMNDFKKVKDGNSKLAFDGADEKIIVQAGAESDSIINGTEDLTNYAKIEKFDKLINEIKVENK